VVSLFGRIVYDMEESVIGSKNVYLNQIKTETESLNDRTGNTALSLRSN
jgi:hypothetical protein